MAPTNMPSLQQDAARRRRAGRRHHHRQPSRRRSLPTPGEEERSASQRHAVAVCSRFFDPLSLPPDELAGLGRHLSKPLVDRLRRARRGRGSRRSTRTGAAQDRTMPRCAGRAQRRSTALRRRSCARGCTPSTRGSSPGRQLEQPARCSPTWSAPAMTRTAAARRRRGASAVELATIDWLRAVGGDAPRRPRASSSRRQRRHAHRAGRGAHARVDDRDQATACVQEPRRRDREGVAQILGFNPRTCACCSADPDHRLQPAAIDAAIHARPRGGPRAVRRRRRRRHARAPAPSTRSTTSPTSPSAKACGSTSTAPTARPRA